MPWPVRMILILTPLVLLAEIYVGYRAVGSLAVVTGKSSKSVKWIVFALLPLVNLLPLVLLFHYFTGDIRHSFIFNSTLSWKDFLANFPFWWSLTVAIAILPYFLILEIPELIFRFRKRSPPKLLPLLRIIIAVIFLVFVTIRIFRDTYHVKNTQYTVSIAALPPSLQGLKLSLLGDIQFDRYTNHLKSNQVNKILSVVRPDLLFFSGDLVTSGQNFISTGLDFLGKIPRPVHSFACMGDHDYWANPKRIASGIALDGWNFLQNRHQLIIFKQKRILITGITHIYSRHLTAPALNHLMDTAPPADLKILLVHQPSPLILNVAAAHHYQILLAGHTHGGQIVFKPFGYTLTPSKFENPIISGFQLYQKMNVIVTNGVGLTLAPIRFRAPAEVTTIILNKK